MPKTKKQSKPKRTAKASTGTRKERTKRLLVTTLAVGATGIIGYFGWQYFKRKRQGEHDEINSLLASMDQPIVTQPLPPKPRTRTRPKAATVPYTAADSNGRSDDFPLSRGSKGENVKKLQEALIAKYGKSTLPKYGADGDFGSEMVAALKKLGLPATITQSTFNVIAQGTVVNPAQVGKELYAAALAKDYAKAVASLQKLRGVDDYTAASEAFKQNRLNGVRQTLVNGLLNVFTSETQKQAIKFQFLRMGLQFDGSKWSLSGFNGLPIITTTPTSVWVNATQSVKVPSRMVLGNEVSRRLDYTLFENSGRHFLVQTKSVKYL